MSPHLRGGDPLRRAPEDGHGDPDYWEQHVGDHGDLDGFHRATATDFSGYDREPHIAENEDEIVAEYARQTGAQPQIECAYCGNRHRARTLAGALRWFQAHDCATLYAAEQAAIIYDLTDRLAA